MANQTTNKDGSISAIFEVGDRVRVIEWNRSDSFWVKVGDIATVTRCSNSPTIISHIDIKTDYCRIKLSSDNGGRYIEKIRPWQVELVLDEYNT